MKSVSYLIVELFLLFVALPLSFTLLYSIWIKLSLGIVGFGYVVYILKRVERLPFKIESHINWNSFFKRLLITFILVVVLTTLYVWYSAPTALFYVPKHKPRLFLIILMVYTFLSVWPQELVYRAFFFKRYERIFRSKSLLVFVNAVLFSLAHLFFRNTLVSVLTFFGGLLFALSYVKFRSTTLVSIEHAIYGNWLFTVGMGEMLAFPGMEN